MPIQLVSKSKHKQTFRLANNAAIAVLGLLNQPPEEVRYSNNASIRMLEVGADAIDLKGKQIRSVGKVAAYYLIGSFLSHTDALTYKAYECTHLKQIWSRQLKTINEVTKKETTEMKYTQIGVINISVLMEINSVNYTDSSPSQYATIRTTDSIQTGDIVGDFLIRDVHLEDGLYCARAIYKAVEPNG